MRLSMVRDARPKLQTIASVVLLLGGTALVVARGLVPDPTSWTDSATMALFVAAPFLLAFSIVRLRKRRISASLVSAILLSTLLFGMFAQIATGVSPPDRYYLHDTATSGISPAGEHMNATQGTAEATLAFDTVSQEAYWYVDETWPSGSEDFALAAGNYTFNLYFDERPRPWWNTSYAYRRAINITTGASSIPVDYPVNLTFDHASFVSQGKAQGDGDDVRVVFWNGTSWVETNRTLGSGSSWNDNATKIWFETKGAIPAAGADTNHLLYYGNTSAANPPTSSGQETGIRSVQSGTATSPGGTCPDPGGCVTTVTIGAVNVSKAFLLFSTRSNSNEPGGSFLRGRLNTSTTVEFVRTHDVVLDINIQWYVVEYHTGVAVQRGEIARSALTENVTISPIASVSQAFVTWSKTPTDTDGTYGEDDAVLCEVTSTTSIECRSDAFNSAHRIWWQVVEFTESADINVQKGSTSLIDPATTDTVTLGTAVDVNRTFVLVGYRTEGLGSNPDIGRRMIRAQLTDSTTITIDRNLAGPGENITEIVWQAVELTDGTFVQRGSENFPSADAQEVVALATTVDVDRSAAFASGQTPAGLSTGRTPYTGDDIVGVTSSTLALNGTHLTLDRDNTADAADIGWFVVEWEREKPTTSLGAEATGGDVEITVHVHHTRPDGTDRQEIVTSSAVTISDMTTNPLALNVGMGAEQTFTASDPRRLRLLVNVTAVRGDERFVLAYNSTANPTNLETPVSGVRPLLSNPFLTPASGTTTTNFNFTIDYAHPSGIAANVVSVNVSDATNGTYNNFTMSRAQTPELDYFVQEFWALNGTVNSFANAQSDTDSGASALLVQEDAAGGGSIGFDAVSSDNTTTPTLTFSHTIGGGSNRLLVVSIGVEAPLGNTTIDNVTYDGVSMTLAVQNVTGTSFHMRTAIYYLLDADLPAAGTYTVSINASLADDINAGAVSVTGAAQQAPEATANSGDGQSGDDWIETQITTLTDGAWIFDGVGSGNAVTGFTPNSGQTERFDITGGSSGTAGGTKAIATAGTEVINWTTDSSSNRISHSLAAFAPAGARLLIQFNTTGVRSSGQDVLVLRYNLTSADDAFGVWLWDFTASDWRQRGTLDQTALSFFNYTLTTDEKGSGIVRLRFNDTSDSGTTDLSVDYQLVNNTLWTTGVTYFVNTTLAVGEYSHFFWANDTNGVSNRTATFAGPSVTGPPTLANFRLQNAAAASRVGEQLDVDAEHFFLFNVTDTSGWSDVADDGNVSLRLWYDGDVATTTQRDATACEAIGANWTSCPNAFASNDSYAHANETSASASLLIDLTSTSAATAPATWANVTDLNATASVAGPGSVLILSFAMQQTLAADQTAEYRFAIDGTRDGPHLLQFNDAANEGTGLSMMFAVTGLSAGSHTFAVQWQDVSGTPTADTSRTRSFQVVEIAGGASVLVDVESTTSGSAPASWGDVPDLTGSPTVTGPSSVVLLLSGVQQGGSDNAADYQFNVDGTREGPQLTQFFDNVASGTGLSIAHARTGLAAGSHTFSLQWQLNQNSPTLDTGRNRTFQVVEITNANLLVDVVSTSSGTAPGSWADVPDLTGSPTLESADSVSLLLANVQLASPDTTDRSADFRLAVDGSREGGQIVAFQDWVDGRVGPMMLPWFRTGLSGTHTFSAQWQNLQSSPTLNTSVNRSFQVLEFTSVDSAVDTAWRDFGFALGTDPISAVEVGVEWFRNNTAPILNITLSWDGGSTWASNQTATNKSADDDIVEFLDFTSATAWTATKLNDANLRVRVGSNASGARLDHVTVRVVTRSELTYTEQTTGANYRIELKYVDTADPGNASLSEWSVTEGSATYNASASSQTEIFSGPTLIGYEFNLSLTLGFQVKQANDPINSTPGSYNDVDSWNGEIEASDGTEAATLRTASTGEHMEFGVFMYTNVTIGGDWNVTGFRGQTVNSNTITVTYRSNDDFNLTIWFTTHLVKGGDTIDISNVQILAAADSNDNITSDTAFAGLGEANLIYILGSASWFFPHATDANENTTSVQFSVSIPGGQAFGTYTAQLVVKIQQKPSG